MPDLEQSPTIIHSPGRVALSESAIKSLVQAHIEKSPVQRAHGLSALIRAHADATEAQRHLQPEVAQVFTEQGLYRVAAPADCYGSEQSPRIQMAVIEAIAKFDGAAAWNLMIGIESFGLIAPGFVDCLDLIADPMAIIASFTAAVGRADKVPGGYRVSGQWQFVSGIHNATVFGATVRIWQDGERLDRVGNRYAMIPAGEYEILDTWHTSGLRGSGSHDVLVTDVFVAEERLVAPIGGTGHASALLNFPLGARLAYNKVAIAWGLAAAAIDSFTDLAAGKTPRFSRGSLQHRPRAQRALAEATVRFRSGKALVLELLDEMWEKVQQREHISSQERGLFQLACSDAVAGCIECVDTLAQAAGTTASQEAHPLERLVRDIRVVGQHTSVAPQHIEDAGRLLLGLPAEEVMLAGVPAD